ncbi:hypothetical protein ACE6H2_016739 [Prunus campanulata]
MHANPSLLILLLIYGLLLLSQSSYMVKATDGFSGLSTNELKLVSRYRGRSPPPAPKPHVPLHFLPRPKWFPSLPPPPPLPKERSPATPPQSCS